MNHRMVLALSVLLFHVATVSAEQAASQTAGVAAAQAPEVKEAKPLSPEEQIRAQLDGSQWTVQLTPSSGSKGLEAQKDTISFTQRQVTSEFLSKAGYPATNYSLSIGGDGRAVWETMQTKENEGVAFWRGELEGLVMQGVLSKHPTEGTPEDYSISGQAVGEKKIAVPSIAQKPVSAVSVAPPKAPDAVVSPKQPEKKKKKRGWF